MLFRPSDFPGLASAPARYGSRDASMKYFANSSRDQRLRAYRMHRTPAGYQQSRVTHAADDVPFIIFGTKRPELRRRTHVRNLANNSPYSRCTRSERCQRSKITVTGPSFTIRPACSRRTPQIQRWRLARARFPQRSRPAVRPPSPGRPHSTKGVGPWRCRRRG